MRLALRELWRQPGRFVTAGVILTVLGVLLTFLGGLLDGLIADATGAFRAQRAELIVYSADARDSLPRSRIDASTRERVEPVTGVGAVGALASVQLGARPGDQPETRDLVGVVVFGYELAPRGVPTEPPATGEVVADGSLRAEGVQTGDVVLVGPARSPLTVIGFVDDTRYSGQAALWGSFDTWRRVVAANRLDRVTVDDVVPALVVATTPGARPDDVAAAIDEVAGVTSTLTIDAAIDALPGVSAQRSTFNQLIGVTAVVVMLVVGLFFALITVERTPLYGLLRAIGAPSRTLIAGVVAQAVVITMLASAGGAAIALGLDAAIPAGAIPYRVSARRLLTTVAIMLAAAVAGSAFSLRRVLRIEPASAIGA